MSVKLQDSIQEAVQEKIQDSLQDQSVRQETKELAHLVGERLTGGPTQIGYLAVCPSRGEKKKNLLTY